jgi:hypothetical protein
MTSKKLLFFLLLPLFAFSQNKMVYKDIKTYSATPSWNFISENYALTGEVVVQIAKAETGGILKLAVNTTNPDFIIRGTVYIYLANNTIITCTDKGDFESKGDTITSYFILSNKEIQQIKKINIQSIRFNIQGKSNSFSSQVGNFTAINKKNFYKTNYNNQIEIFETASAIKSLYP